MGDVEVGGGEILGPCSDIEVGSLEVEPGEASALCSDAVSSGIGRDDSGWVESVIGAAGTGGAGRWGGKSVDSN
ncbi:hypothetical protein K9N68_39885 (plasmid) [Kovacikia minuta CCNUW1]|uniref:hypothetical protein n=1 Tax=Kovacikia minuta TaxID=2931930 RepID=UPI001CCE7148|nr:hypothetical protein [Kovacikia minuta]UBF30759.1 hypothetical protein K9N68_39885 [Kovacikia minuta CCNUW1]